MYIGSGTSLEELKCQVIKRQIKDSVIDLIDRERNGRYIDMALLKDVIAIFFNVERDKYCYRDDIEIFLLNATREYYSVKFRSWKDEYSCSDYMVEVEKCLKQEKDRCAHLLHPTSEQKLLEEVRDVLLTQYLNELLHDGKIEDLPMIYTYILSSAICGGLESNVDMFKKHVMNEGTTMVKEEEESSSNKKVEMDMAGMHSLVGILNKLHDKYASVMEFFQGHMLFHGVVEEAFDRICNNNVSCSSSAELLATFMDNIMKKGCTENLSDEDIEDSEKVLRLLAYIRDKEPFALSYWDNLGRRLILNENCNDEYVRNLLAKLEPQLGSKFTSRMKRMRTDIIVACDHQTEFNEFVIAHPELNPGIVLDVTVLSKGPCYKTYANRELKPGIDLAISAMRTGEDPSFEATIIPPEIVKSLEVFETFYQGKCKSVPEQITRRKKLIWLPSLLTCTIDAKFDAENIELIVTRSQAQLLQLFNESDRLFSSEIVTQLKLPRDYVACLLYSISCGVYKILKKYPTNTTISTNDIFELNLKFTNGGTAIKIPLPPVDLKMKVVDKVYSKLLGETGKQNEDSKVENGDMV
uniref:Uncharacterized protein n=1 Tax=Avena sativa TaxID=4498 RepID=A0ACD5Y5Q9_AVESA